MANNAYTQKENANDFCRLCGDNLKIKFGNFQKITKYISTENLFKPLPCAKRGSKTLAELCSCKMKLTGLHDSYGL